MRISKLKLEKAMFNKGITTYKQLESLSGVGGNTMWRGTNKGTIKPFTICRIAKALGVAPEELLAEDEISFMIQSKNLKGNCPTDKGEI